MYNGSSYVHRMLRINLGKGTTKIEDFDPSELRKWVGANGVGLKLLYDEVGPEVDPLSPENKLYFGAGPFTGTRMPGSGIVNVTTKGPLTGYMVAAQANGFFGARMVHTGYETIILDDAAPEWSYIYIRDGKVEIRPADKLLGLTSYETEELLKKELGRPRASIASIGPAAENMIPYCAIMFDYGHAAATNGPGTIMASKKVKAIVIDNTSNKVTVYDEDKLNKEIRKEMLSVAEASHQGSMIKEHGTMGYYNFMADMGALTIKNYSTQEWPDIENYYGGTIEENWESKKMPCWACPWAHCADITVTKGKAKGHHGEAPEYEAVSAWCLNIGNNDIGESVRLQNIVDGMGFDLKEVAYTISLCYECFNDGILTLEDTGGLDLTWGNTESCGILLEDIAYRRNFGAKLAGGVKKTAEMIGGEALNKAVYVGRGLAPNVVNGRPFWPLWYNLAMSETGSFYCHAQTDPQIGNNDEIGIYDADAIGKGAHNSAKKTIMEDCIGACNFFLSGDLAPIIKAINAITGWDMTIEEYLEVGDRIAAISRAYNIVNGLTPEQELSFSPRYGEAPHDGPLFGQIPPQCFTESTFRDYYTTSGWDKETSKPLPETLRRLGIEYVIKDLWEN